MLIESNKHAEVSWRIISSINRDEEEKLEDREKNDHLWEEWS